MDSFAVFKLETAVFKLGNGSQIAFFHDFWISNASLEVQFPRLLRVASLSNGWF